MATTMKGTFAELTAQADTVGATDQNMYVKSVVVRAGTATTTVVLQDGDGDEFFGALLIANDSKSFEVCARVKGPITLSTLSGTAAGPVYLYFK